MSAPTTDRAGIRRIIAALLADGWEPKFVEYSDGELVKLSGRLSAEAEVLAVDDAFLVVAKGDEEGWVRFVMGNDPEEVAADWTVNLTAVERETDSWWEGE